jgi:hypothetical protein
MRAHVRSGVIELFDLVDEGASVVRLARFQIARLSTL